MTATLPPTEQRNAASARLSEMDAAEVVALMNSEEYRALRALEDAAPLLAEAARRVADSFLLGGRTVLLGAGTSGRLAVQETAEIPPTFGVAPDRFIALVASGTDIGPAAVTRTEEDTRAAARALARMRIDSQDVVIGIAASGTTPFVRAGLRAAARSGAWTCALANNPGSPVFDDADLGVLLDTGPEILTGSTRLKAGTAQKLALNRITTTAMVLAGRVLENHMIDLTGSNDKLRRRAIRIVMDLTRLDPQRAEQALREADWSVRRAISLRNMPS